jgi:predicted nucleic acid-binding protein
MRPTRPVSPLYLDTSCLLKLFFPEPESGRVMELLADEPRVVVSELGWLEADVQIRGRLRAGLLSRARARRLGEELARTLELEPFDLIAVPVDTMGRARALAADSAAHCRTLDLLHLAVMRGEQLHRLLTNDEAQAAAARGMGFAILQPR